MMYHSYFEAFKAITHLSTFKGNATKNWGGRAPKIEICQILKSN